MSRTMNPNILVAENLRVALRSEPSPQAAAFRKFQGRAFVRTRGQREPASQFSKGLRGVVLKTGLSTSSLGPLKAMCTFHISPAKLVDQGWHRGNCLVPTRPEAHDSLVARVKTNPKGDLLKTIFPQWQEELLVLLSRAKVCDRQKTEGCCSECVPSRG